MTTTIDTIQTNLEQAGRQIRRSVEPTAQHITDAVEDLVEWAASQRARATEEITRAREVVTTRLRPVTRAELAELEARLAAVEARKATTARASGSARTKPATKATSTRKPKAASARKPAAQAADGRD